MSYSTITGPQSVATDSQTSATRRRYCFTTPHGLHVTNTRDSFPWTSPHLHISAESSDAR
ncbi:hypothetical protein LY78DRAFT_685747 [Colletotrichum sublineola]|nr:hypothetical protein LY78DRAFT_685747 [Colletotrichum sublineola]